MGTFRRFHGRGAARAGVLGATATLAVSLLLPVAAAYALPNQVPDGAFTTPVAFPNLYTVYTAPSPFGSWTVTSGSVDINSVTSVYGPRFRAPAGSPAGAQVVDLDGNTPGAISQALPGLVPGAGYQGTFKLNGNPFCGPTIKTMNVLENGFVLGSYSYNPTTTSAFVDKTFSLTAGASTTLTLASTDASGGCGPLVTDVSLTFATPAPTSLVAGPLLNSGFTPGYTANARLTNPVTGLGIPGQTIVFTTGSTLIGSALTNGTGEATFYNPSAIRAEIVNQGYTATYSGTPGGSYGPSTAHGALITY